MCMLLIQFGVIRIAHENVLGSTPDQMPSRTYLTGA